MKFAKKINLIIYTKYSELCKIIKKSNKFTDIDYVQYTVHREVSVCAAVSTIVENFALYFLAYYKKDNAIQKHYIMYINV